MLELKDISFTASSENGKKEILKNISMTIEDGFVAITGPNGGGKSTLAKIISGIIKPTSGKIYLDGEDITELSITERAKKGISFAFQQPVRFKGITVNDLIRLAAGKDITIGEACEYRIFSFQQQRKRCRKCLYISHINREYEVNYVVLVNQGLHLVYLCLH